MPGHSDAEYKITEAIFRMHFSKSIMAKFNGRPIQIPYLILYSD